MNKHLKTALKYALPFWVIEKIKFPLETRMAKGKSLSLPDQKSVLLFTLNKCASTFTPRVMTYLNARTRKLPLVDFEGYYYNQSGEDFKTMMQRTPERYFRPQGIMMAPLRRWYPIPDFEKYSAVLVIRDPRDILPSKYFSQASTHSVPFSPKKRKIFFERRERVKNMSIDEFVHEWAPEIKSDFQEYTAMLDQYQVPVVRYEDIILDFENAMALFGKVFDYESSADEIEELRVIGGYDKPMGEENLKVHTRKRLPGDHKEKLKPETILYLDELFEPELKRFGYLGVNWTQV
ncbi:MAG: sulfotransferase domain-containing protein [Kiritimatiellia bacterium]